MVAVNGRFTLVSEDREGYSIKCISDEIRLGLEKDGYEVVQTSTPSKCVKPEDNVLLIMSGPWRWSVSMVHMLKVQKRYVPYRRLVVLWASNIEESEEEEIAMLGMCAAGGIRMIAYSHYAFKTLASKMNSIFSGSVARKIHKNLHRIDYGIPTEPFVDAGTNDRNKWLVPFNRWADTQKQLKLNHALTKDAILVIGHRGGEEVSIDFKYGAYEGGGQESTGV